jgi:small subunit ribosomal protein S8
MSMTDPISDLLTRIRNAQAANHPGFVCPSSKMRVAICQILKDQGFLSDFQVEPKEPQHVLHVQLRYDGQGAGMILGIERLSRPGRRAYVGFEDIPEVLSGLGTLIMSTNRGIITGSAAKEQRVGGELVCRVW